MRNGSQAVRLLLGLTCAWALVPVTGVGLYRNGSGQVLRPMYLAGIPDCGFFLDAELITPLPPSEKTTSPGKKSGRKGAGRTSI